MSEPKDLVLGRELFAKLCRAAPKDFWAHVLYAGCCLWDGKHQTEAISTLIAAKDLDPNKPNGAAFPHTFVMLRFETKILF
jgi:hypothetical protein